MLYLNFMYRGCILGRSYDHFKFWISKNFMYRKLSIDTPVQNPNNFDFTTWLIVVKSLKNVVKTRNKLGVKNEKKISTPWSIYREFTVH